MKCTVKIATASAGSKLQPVIKIIQPDELKNNSKPFVEDEDGRDDLVGAFLHSPCQVDRNEWFKLHTHFPVPFEGTPTHHITTIAPIEEVALFNSFKHAILGRVVPYEDHVKINRGEVPVINPDSIAIRKAERIDLSVEKHKTIEAFFKWLEETGYCSWEEQQPTSADGRPRN